MPKAVPKKKAKRKGEIVELMSPKAQKKTERQIDHFLMELDEITEEQNENYTKVILAANDESVLEIVYSMVESFRKMQGPAILRYQGQALNVSEGERKLMEEIRDRQFTYMAVRILVACAEWGIRFGNFKLPKSNCAKCGKKVKR